jgi:hypothetical protein
MHQAILGECHMTRSILGSTGHGLSSLHATPKLETRRPGRDSKHTNRPAVHTILRITPVLESTRQQRQRPTAASLPLRMPPPRSTGTQRPRCRGSRELLHCRDLRRKPMARQSELD